MLIACAIGVDRAAGAETGALEESVEWLGQRGSARDGGFGTMHGDGVWELVSTGSRYFTVIIWPGTTPGRPSMIDYDGSGEEQPIRDTFCPAVKLDFPQCFDCR